jgi:iron complex transport system ATP-binding protein
LDLQDISVVRDEKIILGPLSWRVLSGERWVVLGPNGAGKSTLFALAGALIHPSAGTVSILDSQMGRSDVFELRPRIGITSNAIVELIPGDETVLNVVMTSAYAIIGRWHEGYDLWDESRAISLLTILGVRELKDRLFGTLSEGEKKRALIARALMPNPELLLLVEPAAGLDLGGREDLLQRLNALAVDPQSPATIIVTHHVEEIPLGTTHCLILSNGRAIAQGLLTDVLTSSNLSMAYEISVELNQQGGRYFARASSI